MPTETELTLLRRAIQIAADAREHGNHPFGALLADARGRVLLEAENSVVTGTDVTAHAETNLVRAASGRYTHEELRDLTLVTSCEPCAMCSGAIFWAGIGRVVYALDEPGLLEMTGSSDEHPFLAMPCREVFAAGGGRVEVVGSALENEARKPHESFWS